MTPAAEVDVAVAGGSCTGVFAALAAARKGAKVIVIEAQNRFGGTASAGQVCLWHTLMDFYGRKQIINGLTQELLDRMDRRKLVEYRRDTHPDWFAKLNTEELCCELDEMAAEAGIKTLFHTRCAAVIMKDQRNIAGLIVAGKDGLSLIKAKYFIDATGDADIVRFAGGRTWRNEVLQTTTGCVKFSRWTPGIIESSTLGKLIHEAAEKYNMPEGNVWGIKGCDAESVMLAGTAVTGIDPSVQADLSYAEIEARRQMRAIADILAEAGYPRPVMEAVSSLIGIRESCHIHSLYRITADELLSGKQFADAAGKGTYRSDIHTRDPQGCLFRYLDGREEFFSPFEPMRSGFWRDPSLPAPEYYTWPLRSQIPVGFDNLITAGRMIDADPGAYGALRVMVNMNQSGEAAGNAVFSALDRNAAIPENIPVR